MNHTMICLYEMTHIVIIACFILYETVQAISSNDWSENIFVCRTTTTDTFYRWFVEIARECKLKRKSRNDIWINFPFDIFLSIKVFAYFMVLCSIYSC